MRTLAPRRLWFFLWALGLLALVARAQALDPARFPALERVLAESGGEAEQCATLQVLASAAQQAGPAGQTLVGVYYNALNDLDFRLRNGEGAVYAAFSQELQERLAEDGFRARVLARFGLAGPAPAPQEEGDELERALRDSAPHWIAALVVVLLASPVFVFLLDRRDLKGPAPANDALPDELRSVRVLGRSYAVETRTGLVVDKESHTEQHLHVSTTGGVVSVVGDQVSSSPVQVHAHTATTRKDCLWVRDAAGNERAWNFTNAALQARTGHTVSVVARPTPAGQAEFLLAFNHTTGQLDHFDGLARAHKARRLLPWLATTLLGAAMVLLALRALVDASGELLTLPALFQLGNWTSPLVLAGLAALLPVAISAWLLGNLRTRAFLARCAPAYRKHLEERARA